MTTTPPEPSAVTEPLTGAVTAPATDPAVDPLAPRVDVSLLVPVKDEVDSLDQLTAEIDAAMAGFAWELVYVDDGSTDGSWQKMADLSAQYPQVRAIRMRRNFGKSAALRAGLAETTGDVVATLDGDLQDDPAELPGLIAMLDQGADVVTGHKADRRDPLGKTIPSKFFNFVTGVVTGLKLRDHNCGLKVARRAAFSSVPLYGEMHRYFAAISHAQGFRVVEQDVHHRPRLHGRSKFGLERYTRGALDLLTVVSLTRYNHRPAHLFGGLGLVMGLIGFLVLAYLTVVWAFTDQAIGDRPLLLMGVLFMVLSAQLISLGLVAELIINREVVREDPQRHVTERT